MSFDKDEIKSLISLCLLFCIHANLKVWLHIGKAGVEQKLKLITFNFNFYFLRKLITFLQIFLLDRYKREYIFMKHQVYLANVVVFT